MLVGCEASSPKSSSGASATPERSDAWFSDVSQSCGIDFEHNPGPAPPERGSYFMPQIMGSGVALFDYDNDGRLDIYLLENAGPESKSTNRLYRQDQDGHFVDATAGSGLDVAGYSMGVAAGDVNNDGRVDLLLTQYGGCRLLLNRGAGKFDDITSMVGIDSPLWSMSAAMFDYDRDGWLDLFVVNYVDYDPARRCGPASGESEYCAPNEFNGTASKLFHNLGPDADDGNRSAPRFADVTLSSGVGRVAGPGLGVLVADFNADRWPDVFVANDGQPNRLWMNNHDGTFSDEAALRGVAYNAQGVAEASMGVAWGDAQNRGRMDLFVTHLGEETHTLWLQESEGLFEDRTVTARLARTGRHGTGFGAAFSDFDQDGSLDLAIANGRIARGKTRSDDFWDRYRETNQLLAYSFGGTFRDISDSNAPLCNPPGIYRGLACGDLNQDGAPDLVITDVVGPARVLLNSASGRGHWLLVRAFDPALNRDALGAQVTVVTDERRFVRLLHPASSYLSSQDPRGHFGLGPEDRFDRIEVDWPDGTSETFGGGDADRFVTLHKGTGPTDALGTPDAK